MHTSIVTLYHRGEKKEKKKKKKEGNGKVSTFILVPTREEIKVKRKETIRKRKTREERVDDKTEREKGKQRGVEGDG